MYIGDHLRKWSPLFTPPPPTYYFDLGKDLWDMSRRVLADSEEDVEVDAPSPELWNRELAAAPSRARKETTRELELKVSQLQGENSLSPEMMNQQQRIQYFSRSRLEGMASQQEVEVNAPLPNIRNRESAAALSHARKETYINELELKVPQLEEETSKLKEAKTYIKELELKDSPLEEENSKLKEAKANQFTTGSKKDGKKTETKTGLGLNLEDLEPHFGKRLEDVAEELDVGRSTIKRACRKYGINRWPCNKKNKSNPCNKKNRSNPTNGISCRDSQQNVPPSAASSKNVAMKVRFEDNTIKFDFCLSSGMEKLLSEVGRRLNLEVGGFKLKYLDEDGDDILLACDDDLQFYLKSLANAVENTCIKMFVRL